MLLKKVYKYFCLVLFISIIAGILESGIVYTLANVFRLSRTSFEIRHLIVLSAISSIIWLSIIAGYSLFWMLIMQLKKTFRYFLAIIPVVSLMFLILLDISSWKFYFRNSFFLINNSIVFALSNFRLLFLHFFQTSLGLIIILLFVTLLVSLLMNFVFLNLKSRYNKFDLKLYQVSIIIIGLFCILLINFHIEKKLFHPFLSALNIVNQSQNIDETALLSLMTPKLNNQIHNETIPSKSANEPVIVIMIESMRMDLINLDPSPIPFMKSLISQAFFFDKSYATSTHSNYSDISIWYSRYPLRADFREPYSKYSPSRGISVFEYFKMNNYKTGYISSQNEKWGDMINWLEDKGIDYFYHSENYDKKTWYNKDDKRGLGRLIKEKIATAGKIEDSETLRIAKNWITSLNDSESFFLGMNLQNTHFNYLIPEGGEEPFQPSDIDFPMVYSDWPEDKAVHVRNRYYNAFFNIDKLINDFVDFLKKEGIWDNCYFVIIGDSGEAFYEHGFANHSGTMYDEIIRTFTLIKPPKGIATSIIEKPISHIDLFPTLLDLMKLQIPDSFQGYSVFSDIEPRHIFVHNNTFIWQDGIVEWPWKLLKTYHPFNERIMFNLENDPEEINDVISEYQDKADELENMIGFWHSAQLEYYQKPEYYIKYNPPRIP